jgi:hypothetical protein
MTPEQIRAVRMASAATVAAIGTLVAAAIAIGTTPLTPLGTARELEPQPGVRADWGLIALGAAGLIGLALAVAATAPTRRQQQDWTGVTRAPQASGRPWLRRLRRRLWALPALAAGITTAFDSGGSGSRVGVRSTVAIAVVAVAGATGILTFNAGLGHLLGTPRLFGQNFDAWGSLSFNAKPVADTLAKSPQTLAVTSMALSRTVLGGRSVSVAAVVPRKGSLPLSMLAGRPPVRAGEVVLGTDTMRSLGIGIGDRLTADGGGGKVVLRVVGRAVLPNILSARGSLSPAHGAIVTPQGAQHLSPNAQPPNRVLVRWAPGADRARAIKLVGIDGSPPVKPWDIANFGGVDRMPTIVVALFVVAGLLSLIINLLAALRRNSEDIAILKTLGFVRGQVLITLCSHALAIGVLGLLIGWPLGVAAGRLAWNLYATRAGFVADAATPIGTVLLVIPAVLAAGFVIGLVPGVVAARAAIAPRLRAE